MVGVSPWKLELDQVLGLVRTNDTTKVVNQVKGIFVLSSSFCFHVQCNKTPPTPSHSFSHPSSSSSSSL